jgi:predicted RNase H-related nuclease YkuK (DUF458 family)
MLYKKMYGNDEFELIPYIKEYLSDNDNIQIIIGGDSQNTSDKTIYVVSVVFYRNKKGAHVIYKKWKSKKELISSVRILNEVWHAIEVAEEIKNSGVACVSFIDLDINPSSKYKSNEVFNQAVGMVESMGYPVRYKTMGIVATYSSDYLVKK